MRKSIAFILPLLRTNNVGFVFTSQSGHMIGKTKYKRRKEKGKFLKKKVGKEENIRIKKGSDIKEIIATILIKCSDQLKKTLKLVMLLFVFPIITFFIPSPSPITT